MQKYKAEIVNQRKTKLNNDNTSERSPQTSKTKTDEPVKVRRTREVSTDRSNLKKSTISTIPTKKETTTKRVEVVNSRNRELLKQRVTPRTTGIVSTSKTSLPDKKSSSTNALKQTPKPMKALKSNNTNDTSVKRGTRTSLDTTSSRVTKQQYFPKKFPFSSHLYENDQNKSKLDINSKTSTRQNITTTTQNTKTSVTKKPENQKKLTRERTMTTTSLSQDDKTDLNPTKVENSRPITATIRKHYVEEEQPTSISASNADDNTAENKLKNLEEPDDYEDDFESYESDFEAYTSSSSSSSSSEGTNIDTSTPTSDSSLKELSTKRTNSVSNDNERKLDSGTYDLPDIKHKQLLDGIKEAIARENSDIIKRIKKSEITSNPASLSDEGFEDGSKYSLSNNGFINFTNLKVPETPKSKHQKRGDDLMNMIRLNSVYFNLFDMNSVSYEDFMQSYGKSGTIQTSSQTGDDDVNEEIQTDNIPTLNKWTQYPVRFSKIENQHISQFDEQLGVGNDPPLPRKELVTEKSTNSSKKLLIFLERSCKILLNIFDFNSIRNSEEMQKNNEELIFSDGYFKLNMNETPFLKNRPVSSVTFSKHFAILTVHKGSEQSNLNSSAELLQRPIICIWNLTEPMCPKSILVSSGEITKATFDSIDGHLVFAAIEDGSISVWDLWETENLYRTIYDENTNKNFIMRPSTNNTIANIDLEPSTRKMIAIQSFQTHYISDDVNNSNVSTLQVCTLDEIGNLIIWSVLQNKMPGETHSKLLESNTWSYIKLIQGLTVSLQKLNPDLEELECYDLQFSETDSHHIYISSNYGVLHYLTSTVKPKPKIYTSQTDDSAGACVEMCPFSSNHFLVGGTNGNITLHSRLYGKPLETFYNVNQNFSQDGKIEVIQWSNSRPYIFFVRDTLNCIYIWNLLENNKSPIHSMELKCEISDLRLSPNPNNLTDSYYMAIATKKGDVYLHNISKEFRAQSLKQYKNELSHLLNYINRL